MVAKLWLQAFLAWTFSALSVLWFPEFTVGTGESLPWRIVSLDYLMALFFLLAGAFAGVKVTARAGARFAGLPLPAGAYLRWRNLLPLAAGAGCLGWLLFQLPWHGGTAVSLFIAREALIWRGKRKAIRHSGWDRHQRRRSLS